MKKDGSPPLINALKTDLIIRMTSHIESFSHRGAKWAGSSSGLVAAAFSMIVWITAGAIFNFSAKWESAFTLYLSVITFLMVFIIQRGQNKELTALHVKLNELIVSTNDADNRLISVEELSEKEISDVQDIHRKIISDEIAVAEDESRGHSSSPFTQDD